MCDTSLERFDIELSSPNIDVPAMNNPTVGDCHQLGNLDCLLIVSQYVFYYPIYHFDCHEVVPERDPAGSLIIREQSPLL